MRVNISLPKELLEDVDKYCKRKNFNRSEWIRFLVRRYITEDKDILIDNKGNEWICSTGISQHKVK